MATAQLSLQVGRGGSRNRAGNPLRKLRGGFSWRWSPNTVFHMGAAVPGKAHGGWGGEMVLWPLSMAKSTFSSSVWGQRAAAEGSSQGRGVPARGRGVPGWVPLGRAWSVLWEQLGTACAISVFSSWCVEHCVKLNPAPFAGATVGCGGAKLVLRQSQVIYVWAATWCGWDQGRWWVASGDLLDNHTWDPKQTAPVSLRFRLALVSEHFVGSSLDSDQDGVSGVRYLSVPQAARPSQVSSQARRLSPAAAAGCRAGLPHLGESWAQQNHLVSFSKKIVGLGGITL